MVHSARGFQNPDFGRNDEELRVLKVIPLPSFSLPREAKMELVMDGWMDGRMDGSMNAAQIAGKEKM